MNLERIDAFDINFVDSAARKEFKLSNSTGAGESRIYIGNDEERYDDFFDFENVEYCVTEKNDILKYIEDAHQEYMFPSQSYKANITEMYNELKKETKIIPDELLKYSFRKKFDDQNRYYLVLEDDEDSRKNYNYIRNVVLPRITKYCFIKFREKDTQKLFIYMRPILFNDLRVIEEIKDLSSENNIEMSENKKKIGRLKQGEYRRNLLDIMPFCPFTKVTDDRILIACHIKPFSVCDSDEERYDSKNGITMTPTYHSLFDLGFISFENSGALLVSPFLSNITKQRLNLRDGDHIRLQTGSDKYLQYHRDNIFCKMPYISLEEIL
jgi:putative restriction endonuclease